MLTQRSAKFWMKLINAQRTFKKPFKNCLDPPAPLRNGGELIKLSSSPFLRRIEGDLLESLTVERQQPCNKLRAICIFIL
jgi:hypothetical protein